MDRGGGGGVLNEIIFRENIMPVLLIELKLNMIYAWSHIFIIIYYCYYD